MASAGGRRAIRVHNIEVSLEHGQKAEETAQRPAWLAEVAQHLGLRLEMLGAAKIIRRALDARRQKLRYNLSVDVEVPEDVARELVRRQRANWPKHSSYTSYSLRAPKDLARPVVVGAGPAGLFAALVLAEAGFAPLLIERGRPVEQRARDVSRLYARGELNPESNVCYGEGGAGTFSDGKLYTRVGDARVARVMQQLVRAGAPEDILIDNRPHLGTDRLVALLQTLRRHLTRLGVEFAFDTAVEDFDVRQGKLRQLRLAGGACVEAAHVVLATGHSAHPIWSALARAGAQLQARPFAVGFRIEHPQEMIDLARYGRQRAEGYNLPAADYRLTYQDTAAGHTQRGVWSFCMCPGGVVVATPTEDQALCINGMSHASRRGRYANSALVVEVGPQDFLPWQQHGVFAGVHFQHAAERLAYQAGGGAYVAPAARACDFVAGRVSVDLNASSYRRGLWPADLTQLYPETVTTALRHALMRFDQQIKGFASSDATLIGVETRTASPIRVLRHETGQATCIEGLYPAGEGMGYGGGIVSAAVDGMRAAENLLQAVGAQAVVQSG